MITRLMHKNIYFVLIKQYSKRSRLKYSQLFFFRYIIDGLSEQLANQF